MIKKTRKVKLLKKYKWYLLVPVIGIVWPLASFIIFKQPFKFDPFDTAIAIELFLVGIISGFALAHAFVSAPDNSRRIRALVGYLVSAPFSFFINLFLTNGLQGSLTWHEMMSLSFITEGLLAAFLASTLIFTGVILGRGAAYTASGSVNGTKYASFVERTAAFGIDFIVTVILWILVLFPIAIALKLEKVAEFGGYFPSILIIMWLYYSLMESSVKQATLGKMAIGLVITDLQEHKITFLRATVRFWVKLISFVVLFLGFLMIFVTPKKQGLHDIIAGCLVLVKKGTGV